MGPFSHWVRGGGVSYRVRCVQDGLSPCLRGHTSSLQLGHWKSSCRRGDAIGVTTSPYSVPGRDEEEPIESGDRKPGLIRRDNPSWTAKVPTEQ